MTTFKKKIMSIMCENIFNSRTELTYDEIKFIFDQLLLGVGINKDALTGKLEHAKSIEYAGTKLEQLAKDVNEAFAKRGILKRYRNDLINEIPYKAIVDIADKLELWKECC